MIVLTSHRSRRRRAATLAEACVALLIVATAGGASLQAALLAKRTARLSDDTAEARMLIRAFFAQIAFLDYSDPLNADTTLGIDAGEVQADPVTWDDIDDPHGWSGMTPLVTSDVGWSLSVTVVYLRATDLVDANAGEDGLKQLTVTATHNGRAVLTQTLVRTRQ